MQVEAKNEDIIIHFLEEKYMFTRDELREFEIEIEFIPSDGFRPSYYWIVSTSSDPLYKEMSALVFCDLQDAIKRKKNRIKREIVAG